MKYTICAAIGSIGSFIALLFGGWDTSIITLLIFMLIDYITGLLLAGVFKKSKKSETGGLNSHVGWKGIVKKGVILLIVIVATRLDMTIGTTYIRDGVCIAFMANELLSIVENAGLMGIPIPSFITKAIELLNEKGETK